MTERRINLPGTRRNRAPVADGAIAFADLAIGAHFRFAATPRGAVHRKVDRNQYRIAGKNELFRLGRNTLVVPVPDQTVSPDATYRPLARTSQTGLHAAQRNRT